MFPVGRYCLAIACEPNVWQIISHKRTFMPEDREDAPGTFGISSDKGLRAASNERNRACERRH